MEHIKSSAIEFFLGIYDSLQIFSIYGIISKSSKISNNLFNCFLLNGFLYIGSMIFYIFIIEPCIEYVLLYVAPLGYVLLVGKYFFYIFWLIPLYLLCNIITSFWIDEIYYESLDIIENTQSDLTEQEDSKEHLTNINGRDLVTIVSNQIERLLIIICFPIYVSILNFLNFIPLICVAKFSMLAILNSLYIFEYILLQKYIFDYKEMIYFIEKRFFYFLGFGILLTILITQINSVTINSSIFLMAFPLFLIASLKVSEIRFGQECFCVDEKYQNDSNRLIFLYPIEKLYGIGIKILTSAFKFIKKVRRKKNT